MKYAPVSLYKQYMYKIAPNYIINTIMIILTLVMLQYFLKMPLITLALIFVISMVMSALQSILMLIIDLKKPKLEWDSEYAVVKQNMNLMYPMILSLVNIGVIVLVTMFTGSMGIYVGSGVLLLLYGGLTYLVSNYLYKNQNKLAEKIM